MANTNFVDSQTPVVASWLNDVNDLTYSKQFPDGKYAVTVSTPGALVDSEDVSYQPAGTGAVATTVQSKLRETVSVKDFGAVGDGVTDDTAAYLAAEAIGASEIYVPSGNYVTTLAPDAVTTKLVGPGFTMLNGDYQPHRVNEFVYVKSATAPTTWSDPGNPAQAMSGELVGKAGVAAQTYIDGANTAGTPTTGYAPVRFDLAQSYLNMVFASGHNQSTSDAIGRTGVGQYASEVVHLGQGDTFNFVAGGYVNNPTPTKNSHWLADPALTILAGGITSVSDSANIVASELSIGDNGKKITGSGHTVHLNRSVVPSPNPKEYVWQGFTVTSRGGQPVDSMFQGVGPSRIGLDFSAATFSDNNTAIALPANSKINFNSTNTSWINTSLGTIPGNTAMGYNATTSQIDFDIAGTTKAVKLGSNSITLSAYGNNPYFTTNYARGTSAAPTIVQAGDTIGTWVSDGYDGTQFTASSIIQSVAYGTPSTNSVASYFAFLSKADGATSLTTRFIIKPDTVNSAQDALANLGAAGLRWNNVYAANGSIITSDEREKQQVRDLSDKEKVVATKLKGMIKAFKFNSAVQSKGSNARWHFGVIAQEVRSAFESEGLIGEEYGMFCYDEWEETPEIKDSNGNITQEYKPAGNRYGVRYEELLAFILGAL